MRPRSEKHKWPALLLRVLHLSSQCVTCKLLLFPCECTVHEFGFQISPLQRKEGEMSQQTQCLVGKIPHQMMICQQWLQQIMGTAPFQALDIEPAQT